MSLENNIERIASALELIANYLVNQPQVESDAPVKAPRERRAPKTTDVVVAPENVATPPVQAPPVAAPPTTVQAAPVQAAPVQAAPVQAAPVVAPPVTMTVQELNAALVIEFQRLGSDRTPIDEEMSKLGVTSINDLPADKYLTLLGAVKARVK